MTTIVWHGGRILAEGEPAIDALSHGYTVGDGAFETIGVRGGEPFALTLHLNRLEGSLSRLRLGDLDRDAVRDGVAAVLEAGSGSVTRLRVTVSAGSGPLGSARPDSPLALTVAGSPSTRAESCVAVRAPWRRNEFSPVTGVKTTSYAENVMLLAFARDRGADEAWVQNTRGHLCEGSGSNIFIERGGEILTPPLSSGCLAGVTRGLALQWGAAAGLPVREAVDGELPWAVLDELTSGEVFAAATSATRGVQPVSSLDGEAVPVGPVLARLHEVFEEAAEAEHDPVLGGA